VERHDAGVVLAIRVTPGDALIRLLLGDLGVPLVPRAAELGDPVQVRVVALSDLLHALHELRELLELRPLVVHRVERRLDRDRLLDRRHACPSMVGWLVAATRQLSKKANACVCV
jgi:hypothetical protein